MFATKSVLAFATLALGLSDAARRTTTVASTVDAVEGRQFGHSQFQGRWCSAFWNGFREVQVKRKVIIIRMIVSFEKYEIVRDVMQNCDSLKKLNFYENYIENVWDVVELQKLDDNANAWKNNPSSNATESKSSGVLNTKQLYPTLPTPGDSNELPGPITGQPMPPMTPPPGCYGLRGQFPSPTSCANYLNCWDDTVTEQTCPDGLLFNDLILLCDFDYNVNCGSRPMPSPKPSLPEGSRLCPEPNGRYRSATNCSEFYVCVYRKPIKFGCPLGLVYNDVLSVCDYPYNVDCKGAITPPLPPKPTPPQTLPSQPSTAPQQPPTYAPPSYVPSPQPPQQPPYAPSQPPQQPSYIPSQPPQQPPYIPPYAPPQLPSYAPSQPSSYPSNPWLRRTDPEAQSQETAATQLEIEKEQQQEQQMQQEQEVKREEEQTSGELSNPWSLIHEIPPSLTTVPCKNGDVHRLNKACTTVVVCRNGRPQLLQCLLGHAYDKPSDSCRPFTIAKW
ncbi:uncharacterized protein LOC143426377 [Xylocopa sonorina]|uniref:uncharacterized protein LOC143426377 n=1 Tax=Xylocopa sonorina TaxID=1818115 RepID=UPI00403AA4FE